jgi:hypothetical protein
MNSPDHAGNSKTIFVITSNPAVLHRFLNNSTVSRTEEYKKSTKGWPPLGSPPRFCMNSEVEFL